MGIYIRFDWFPIYARMGGYCHGMSLPLVIHTSVNNHICLPINMILIFIAMKITGC